MLTIGEFSRICFVTKKTLRHYDEIGLLQPEHVAENGYRYYTVSQLRSMLLITRLKSYGFSLPEIAAVLANPSEDYLAGKLLEKRRQMEQKMQSTAHLLQQLQQDVDKLKRRIDIMEQDMIVKTVTLEPSTFFGVRKTISVTDFQAMFSQLYATLGQKGIQPEGPPMAFYHDEDFNAESSDIEVAVPVAKGTPGSYVYPGGMHCFATLVGPYNNEAFTATYAGLMRWIEENGYRLGGPPFDKYVRSAPDGPPEDYVTEIYFPIIK